MEFFFSVVKCRFCVFVSDWYKKSVQHGMQTIVPAGQSILQVLVSTSSLFGVLFIVGRRFFRIRAQSSKWHFMNDILMEN